MLSATAWTFLPSPGTSTVSISIDATSPLIVTPINEASFISWLGGEAGRTSPYRIGQGWEVKYRLMKAYIEGVEALNEVDSGVRILTTEPLVKFTHSRGAGRTERAAARVYHEEQFQVTEMLAGRLCPELRGRPEYLDLMGYNFYYNNQWVKSPQETLDWKNPDARWAPLHQLLNDACARYQRPEVLSGTSHPEEDHLVWYGVYPYWEWGGFHPIAGTAADFLLCLD